MQLLIDENNNTFRQLKKLGKNIVNRHVQKMPNIKEKKIEKKCNDKIDKYEVERIWMYPTANSIIGAWRTRVYMCKFNLDRLKIIVEADAVIFP